ncbi:hypothetical protein QYE76_070525 [Lolium multiflorum]|uniref:DUF1618 domain-containing protein n=1 Tax=Lolium multiflorum TaxID=4521 RepID=A0AAD8SI39_LOLMU|nr:hypothetical protein QYE76_070525 [Lolium multiflorum]
MEESFLAFSSSFDPPAVDRATDRYAPWALLDTNAYFVTEDNDTTAEAITSTGRTVKVTFCLADPPGISYFCVHGPDFQREDFLMEPQVLSSSKNLVLLRVAFTVEPQRNSSHAEFFVYKAGRGNPPSLTPIPNTPAITINSTHPHVCVMPFDDDDGESFLLADLCMTRPRSTYKLHVFSSKTGGWTTTPLQLQIPPGRVFQEDLPSPYIDKVIDFGGGVVGWVDLWRGIVRCNVFDDNPVLSLIPIPILDPNPKRQGDARPVRNVDSCNGFIRFIELDIRVKKVPRKMTKDLDTVDIIYDSELLFHDDDGGKPAEHYLVDDGWKLRSCYRHASWDYWRKGHIVDIDEVLVDNPDHYVLLPRLWDAEAGRSTLRNMYSAYPVLGMGGDDVVYLMSKDVEPHDKNAWMVGVHLPKKTVEVVVPLSSERARLFKQSVITCEFSEYLNAAPSTRAKEVTEGAPNGSQNYHLPSDSSITPNNLQNVWNSGYYHNGCFYGYADGAHPNNTYDDYQHPTLWPAIQPNSTSSESGSLLEKMYAKLDTPPPDNSFQN